ncbi:hypothetical protein [Hymenobacter convexus]|uniref:hypothetical protein n=1 Tax=Hymenobacter sp. CA1UV-4 TaxID=3063782 RepID=UPI002713B79F|nr:hypothetical protein [Hymenobacter sp. CA1UV-4]MDO7854652.1 hypothetical protein [Hymenobacter sp. CA1UV-4]
MARLYRLTFFLLFGCVMSHTPARAQGPNLVIIGNGRGVPSEMNLTQLKATMRGEKLRWPDGSKVVIALLKPNTPTGQNTSKKIYNMSANELNKYWLALVFQGRADGPNFFNSEADLAEFVAQTPGAIGVVTQPVPSSKTVIVEGRKFL